MSRTAGMRRAVALGITAAVAALSVVVIPMKPAAASVVVGPWRGTIEYDFVTTYSEAGGGGSLHKHATYVLDGTAEPGGLQPAHVIARTDEELFGTGPCYWTISRSGTFDDDIGASELVTVRDLDPTTSTIAISLSAPVFPTPETGQGCWAPSVDPMQNVLANMPEVSFGSAVDPLSVSGTWKNPTSGTFTNGSVTGTLLETFDWHLTRDPDSDLDGVPNENDLCPASRPDRPVQDVGCSGAILDWGPQTTQASSPFAQQIHELRWETEFAAPFANPGEDVAFSEVETIFDTLTPDATSACGENVFDPPPTHQEEAVLLWPLQDVVPGDVLGGAAHDFPVASGLRVFDSVGDCFHVNSTNTLTGVFPGTMTQSLHGCYQLGLIGGTTGLDPTLFSGSVAVIAIGVDPATCASTAGGPTVPAAPTIGTATAGNAQASVTFAPPVDDGGDPISSYTASCVLASGGVPAIGTGAASPVVVSNLTNGASYTCTVSATNRVGTGPDSDPSNAFTPIAPTKPGVPGPPTATAGDGRATVSWTAPPDGGSSITGYVVVAYVGFASVRTSIVMSAATTRTIVGLTNGTTYRFRVRAINSVGVGDPSKASNAITPRAPTVPDSPTVGTAAAGDRQATVEWTAPSSDGGATIAAYLVTPYVGYWPLPAQVFSSASRSGTVSGLTNGVTYRFRVQAVNAVGNSAYSKVTNPITPSA